MASNQLATHTPFRELAVYSMDFQVYFANSGREPKPVPWYPTTRTHSVDWVGFFVPPEGKGKEDNYRTWVPQHYWPITRLVQWARSSPQSVQADDFVHGIGELIAGKVPDSTSLQSAHEGRLPGVKTPHEVLLEIVQKVDKYFPKGDFDQVKTPQANYKPPDTSRSFTYEIPVRAIAALVGIALACEEANRGDVWFRTTYNRGTPKIGGCRMAQGIYLYLRYTDATCDQVGTILRTQACDSEELMSQ